MSSDKSLKDNSIPDDVKKQIEAEISSIYKLDTDGQRIARGVYRTAAEFGYNLASKALSDLKEKYLRSVDEWAGHERNYLKEIERLKAEIHVLRKSTSVNYVDPDEQILG